MNDSFDPLETELSALKPHEPSAALRGGIADEVKTYVPVPASLFRSTILGSGAITGGLVAVSLAVTLWLRPAIVRDQEVVLPLAPSQLPVANACSDALPSVWAYQRALARSPEELEALLDKQSVLASPVFVGTPAHVFIHSDAKLLLQGEL